MGDVERTNEARIRRAANQAATQSPASPLTLRRIQTVAVDGATNAALVDEPKRRFSQRRRWTYSTPRLRTSRRGVEVPLKAEL